MDTTKKTAVEKVVEAAEKAGVEVVIRTPREGSGEVVFFPGFRTLERGSWDERRPLRGDDGSGVVDDDGGSGVAED